MTAGKENKNAAGKFKVFTIPSFSAPKKKKKTLLFLIECIVHLDIAFYLFIITMKNLKRKTICYSCTSISN